MFGSKIVRSERSFSLCLAEELLRAELKSRFGDHVTIFSINMKATPPTTKHRTNTTVTDVERTFFQEDSSVERYIKISALFGPMERLFPDNPPTDQRRHLYRINAECRLFSLEHGCVMWRPHFLKMTRVSDSEYTRYCTEVFIYEDGKVDGARLTISPEAPPIVKPCQDMVMSQPLSSRPQDQTPRIDD